ncbi:hypothetical protein ACFLR8_04055 [Bacteroidota bacterium]
MKHSRIVLGLMVLSMISTADLFAALSDGNAVGVPLDGGLLTILGAAGVAYYVARKKKATK